MTVPFLPRDRRHSTSVVVRGCVCALVFAACIASAEDLPLTRLPVTVRQAWEAVVDELRTQGFRQEELPQIEEVELPLAVPVRSAQRLQVSSICWDADARRARFRLECAQAGACLPFLAYVHVASRALAASCRMTSPQHVSQPKLAPAVHAGARVTAVLATAGMRMTLPVTCLDRGALGEVIRVRGHEGRIFRARVTGPAQVEASLP